MEQLPNNPIDVREDPLAYNKDFDPNNPKDFTDWLKMKPTHISEEEWPLRVATLKLCLESKEVKTPHDRSMVLLGWKVSNGLLPTPE